jgi:hypothetical protein
MEGSGEKEKWKRGNGGKWRKEELVKENVREQRERNMDERVVEENDNLRRREMEYSEEKDNWRKREM